MVIDHGAPVPPPPAPVDFEFEASGAKLKVKGQFDEAATARLSKTMTKSAQLLQQVPTAERVERVAHTLIGVLGGVACMAI